MSRLATVMAIFLNCWGKNMIKMKLLLRSLIFVILFGNHLWAEDTFTPYKPGEVPQSAKELWGAYDSRKESLDVKVIKEWKEDGVVTRYITFTVGTFKGVPARIAAYYCFPEQNAKAPAFVWSHGGGQRADRRRGFYFATQGYATVDINWLGRELEKDIKENTDWGKVDPTQGEAFYSKALRKHWKMNLQPDEFTIDSEVSPRNSNWFLLAVAARRAITFLELQPEVDKDKIGFAGYSMGGMITSLTAMDKRLKAAVPFVGGTGFKYEDFPGVTGSGLSVHFKDLELYKKTMDSSAHWPHVTCPVMFLSSSNDFHATFERIYKSMHLLQHKNWRVSTNIHDNHRPANEQWVLLNKWFDIHLKGRKETLPETPKTSFEFYEKTAKFTVNPDKEKLLETEIYYSYDPNSRTRFWNKAKAVKDGNTWSTEIDFHKELPLYAFAICRYKLDSLTKVQNGETATFTLNSDELVYVPENFNISNLEKISTGQRFFEDFSEGLVNWVPRNGSIVSYKFQDPKLRINNDQKLCFNIDPKGKKLNLILSVDSKFLSRGQSLGDFRTVKSFSGDGLQKISVGVENFKSNENKKLEWSKITRFTVSLREADSGKVINLFSDEGLSYLKSIEISN